MIYLERIPVDDMPRFVNMYMCIYIYLFFNHFNHILSLVDFDVDDMFPLYLKDECFMRLHYVACVHSMEHVERYLGHT